jgi:hypothetical protein
MLFIGSASLVIQEKRAFLITTKCNINFNHSQSKPITFMKKLTLSLIIVSVVSIHVCSQPKRDSIKVLFSLMQQDSLIDKTFDAIASSFKTQMQTQLAGLKQQTGGKDSMFSDSMYQTFFDKATQSLMKEGKEAAKKLLAIDMVEIYDKYFTQQEINDFIAFYKSFSGHDLIKKLPDIQKEIFQAMTEKYSPGMQAAYMKEIEKFYIPEKK